LLRNPILPDTREQLKPKEIEEERQGGDQYMLSKEEKEGLINIMNNPTTGLPHNQNVISSQVHAVFAIDSLERTIKELDNNNLKLQKTMLWLTFVTVALTLIEVIKIFWK
jgi:hypothetical protein